jgi:MFS family permease
MTKRTQAREHPAQAAPISGPPLARWPVLATVFTTGAAVLVIEIAGARVVSPLYGSGLYSWSALISVTLAALSLGYWVGGRAADRRPDAAVFHGGILVAGLLVVALPAMASPCCGSPSRWIRDSGYCSLRRCCSSCRCRCSEG